MAAMTEAKRVETWFQRVDAAKKLREDWQKQYEVERGYAYWKGEQRPDPVDDAGDRRAVVNKIHSELRDTLPQLYFNNPFARVNAAPEKADTPGGATTEKAQLLQDTANAIVRDPDTQFLEQTSLALKESFWAIGVCEVGYSATFTENPSATDKPALKEDEDTEVDSADSLAGVPQVSSQRFYVKHIPTEQILVSSSDRAITGANDWIGYWEDYNLEDIKKASAYKNKSDLKASVPGDTDEEKDGESSGDKVRLYKIWDLRTKTRYVLADGHEKFLLKKPFKRLPLKFLRLDIDPYHFYPIPPIFNQLGPQDEYNDSREYLRLVRKGTVPRYTYDEDAVKAGDMTKLERGGVGTYIPRKGNTRNPIEPINQPTFSDTAIKTLTLSQQEMSESSGETPNYQTARGKTATQAVIANTKGQITDSFDRNTVAKWLAEIIEELIYLAIEEMLIEKWVVMNVEPDSAFAPMAAADVVQKHQWITSEMLLEATTGTRWSVSVDVDTLSPAAEQQQSQRWMQAVMMIANPAVARIFALSPEMLKRTLELSGIRNIRDQQLIGEALKAEAQMQIKMAQMAQQALPQQGVSGAAVPAGVPGPQGPVTLQGPSSAMVGS